MVNESNISKLVKDSNLNTKLATLATKVDFFGDNSFQNVYQPTLDKLELKKDKGNKYVFSCKSKRVYTSKLKPL